MIRFFGHILTSLGSKVLIALSGLAFAVFVVFHMLGNLQVFPRAGCAEFLCRIFAGYADGPLERAADAARDRRGAHRPFGSD